MRMHFVFYDYEKGIFPFLLDYLAVMILIAFIGYYSGVFLKRKQVRENEKVHTERRWCIYEKADISTYNYWSCYFRNANHGIYYFQNLAGMKRRINK